jgi:class 3 adenylate cyclase
MTGRATDCRKRKETKAARVGKPRPLPELPISALRAVDDLCGRTLPSGSVAFLFTDIEGSTKLLDELGEEAYGEGRCR